MISLSLVKQIEKKLEKEFSPSYLKVYDVSESHKGHMGYKQGGETHFEIAIISKSFNDTSRINVHRLINEAMKEEWSKGIHSISIKANKNFG